MNAGIEPWGARVARATAGQKASAWPLAIEAAGLVGLLVVAVGLRADRLMTVPAFTDEAIEVLHALNMLRAGRLPLVGVSDFLGGFHTWLLMGLFALFGPAVEMPRLLSCVAGVLTVLLTYALGRELAGRWGGLLAGGLMATNLVHIAINSRIAWSNCVTPLLTTAGLLLVARALRRDRPWLLAPAGASLGLALQTHPTALPLLLGVAVGLLAMPVGRRWLRTRWPWLALLAAAVAYANVLWFNLIWGLDSLQDAQEHAYAVHPATSVAEFAANAGALLTQLARNIGSSFAPTAGTPAYPVTLTMIGVSLLAALGIGACIRRRDWLLPALLPVSVVVTAVVGGEYQPLPHASSRYLAPLWPALFALAGLGAVAVAAAAGRLGLLATGGRRWLAPAALALLGLAMMVESAGTTWRYLDWYSRQPFLGDANRFALEVSALAAGYPGRITYLDQTLYNDKAVDAGTMHRSLQMLLRARGQEYAALGRGERQHARVVWQKVGQRPGLTVMRRDQARQLEDQGAILKPVGAVTRVLDPADGDYRLYEIELPAATRP